MMVCRGNDWNGFIKKATFLEISPEMMGILSVLLCFGTILERNPSLEVVNLIVHHPTMMGEEMEMLTALLSRRTSFLKNENSLPKIQ